MRQQTGASERRQYSDRQEQVSTSNTTGRSRLAPAIEQQAGADQRQQYNNHQEQVCCADRLPSGEKNRLSLMPPIQQHTGICQYTTPYHSAEQRRARKGGARGGKAGFVTPSAFPPRKLAHAKVSPLERKRPPPGASVRRPTLYNIWYNFLIIFINNTITCIL